MLLNQLIASPKNASHLFVHDPFNELDRMELVTQVVALANADVEGPRYILFGVNPGAVEGNGIVGITDDFLGELKLAHRLISRLIEPTLGLAFIFDRIDGKFVGALEIDDCDFAPYFVGYDLAPSMQRGQSWIREGRELRAFDRRSALPAAAAEPSVALPKLPDHIDISVGFNEDADCDFLEIPVPDTSNPPFAEAVERSVGSTNFGSALRDTVGTVTTQILRLAQGNIAMMVAEPETSEDTGLSEHAGKILEDARNHYFFEERAVKLEFCIRNNGAEHIGGISIEFGFPRLPDFDVADRLHVSPFDKRSEAEIRNMGYPEVEARDDAIFVRSPIELLSGDSARSALACPLRLAVGPAMQRRKLGINYTLLGPDGAPVGGGRLKIRFGNIAD